MKTDEALDLIRGAIKDPRLARLRVVEMTEDRRYINPIGFFPRRTLHPTTLPQILLSATVYRILPGGLADKMWELVAPQVEKYPGLQTVIGVRRDMKRDGDYVVVRLATACEPVWEPAA
jgi:hypothetical protein